MWDVIGDSVWPTVVLLGTSTVLAISAGALGYLIGAGGLGDLVFTGISLFRPEIMLAGAIPTALLALMADRGLHLLERRLERRRGASI